MIKKLFKYDKSRLIETLWECDPDIYNILVSSDDLQDARNSMFDHLNGIERHLFNIYSDKHFKDKNLLERNNSKECIRVLKNLIRTENEKISNFSALNTLYKIANKKINPHRLNEGFLFEFIFLFRGINCDSGIYTEKDVPLFLKLSGLEAALERTKSLDRYASNMEDFLKRYKTGMDKDLIKKRRQNRKFIQGLFNADDPDWLDYRWHLKNIISDIDTLHEIVKLSNDELRGLRCAKKYKIPFQITPYYLSLFDRKNTGRYDHTIRAQVLPSENYCLNYIQTRKSGSNMDFMDEKSTSPIKGITRRYPQILILKPFDSCPQICVYCQRNWEITDIKDAAFSKETMTNAIEWMRDNQYITEVLITGGDPLTLSDIYIEWLLSMISGIEHIERIRVGTRIIVTLPQRITEDLVEVLRRYNEFGVRELCIVTHFEHPTEITPDSLEAIKRIKKTGINIYNQQVFTYYNSKKYESSLLRKLLKKSGIDPYYIFNTKGKDETIDYRVPIARIEQERKEEARFLPGLVRTDEPVFNVPRLGKSHIRSWQEHEVIMILQDGRRVYRFYPWESKYAVVEPYNYIDVSIYDYLKRLNDDNENIDDYSSIWYYF
ncbi:KamA family protein [Candidatus Methanoperedens nitroreducens]|uniref:KamA family protein n=1 Tax=Candidatus Methanoperedens nitratireducens TaxID=1392998 RepID=A0A062V5J8_9EURY|nr:KamA family radical SAM protein [Candidatus Methanoperedens nitroreducens]KCZ72597.1 KamA family protein [Candidatus Methanoperedens nitroreducens]MDJ1423471.1 KamA family radical SAM protein [Candidatus Methanoperedens sp.]